jgi:ubiquinone/menaquinone biosynthesis C-methylase UbiE
MDIGSLEFAINRRPFRLPRRTLLDGANRYDSARSLPSQTKALRLDALKSSIPAQEIRKILDLGCGTGRFTATLGKAFECFVVGVEPSIDRRISN